MSADERQFLLCGGWRSFAQNVENIDKRMGGKIAVNFEQTHVKHFLD